VCGQPSDSPRDQYARGDLDGVLVGYVAHYGKLVRKEESDSKDETSKRGTGVIEDWVC
jgi:hypothetical protein